MRMITIAFLCMPCLLLVDSAEMKKSSGPIQRITTRDGLKCAGQYCLPKGLNFGTSN